LCRPSIDARSPSCQWGREQPPGLEKVPTPAPARRVAHAPMSVVECSRALAVICAPNVARCHARTRQRSLAKLVVLLTVLLGVHSRQKSAITSIRIELCSASSRLSLRSTLRASALTPPPRSSRLHLCDGRRSSSSFLTRPHFCVDLAHRQSYREDLIGAIGHPSAVSPDAERCGQRSQSQALSLQQPVV
jgi:hypothetical protein